MQTPHKPNPLYTDVGLLALRVLIAGSMAWFHGFGKLGALVSGNNPWAGGPGMLGLGGGLEFALAALAESVACVLIVFGVGTRFMAGSMIITMLVAAFIAHGNDPIPSERVVINVQTHLSPEGKQALRDRLTKPKPSPTVERMVAAIDAAEQAKTDEARQETLRKANFAMRSGSPELALIYLFAFLAIAIAGAGRISIDHRLAPILRNKLKNKPPTPDPKPKDTD